MTLSRWPLKRVDEAFKAFFRRLKVKRGKAGYPRFRGKSGWRSFGFTEFVGIRLINGRLVVKGLAGGLKLHMHRPLPEGASIWSCVFTKENRAWRVALQIEASDIHTVRREAGNLVGLDWGVETLATLSTGEGIINPRFGTEAAVGIRRASRKLARAKRVSRRRLKAKARLARLQRKLANRRKTYLHQVSAALTRRFGCIAVEDLNIKGMTASAKGDAINPGNNVRQKAKLNREILDTSPGMMMAMLRYKAARAGGRCDVIDARGTSQECSGCGATVAKDLRVRRCMQCDLEVHRDINADPVRREHRPKHDNGDSEAPVLSQIGLRRGLPLERRREAPALCRDDTGLMHHQADGFGAAFHQRAEASIGIHDKYFRGRIVQNPLPVRLGLHREAACFSSRGLSAGETPSQRCASRLYASRRRSPPLPSAHLCATQLNVFTAR